MVAEIVSHSNYLHIRKRVASKLTSAYVNVYADALYNALLRYAREAGELKKEICRVEKRLAQLGYATEARFAPVLLNIDFTRANMKAHLYDQTVLEGMATSCPQNRGYHRKLPRQRCVGQRRAKDPQSEGMYRSLSDRLSGIIRTRTPARVWSL